MGGSTQTSIETEVLDSRITRSHCTVIFVEPSAYAHLANNRTRPKSGPEIFLIDLSLNVQSWSPEVPIGVHLRLAASTRRDQAVCPGRSSSQSRP